MNRIITLALVIFTLVRIGVIEIPEGAIDRLKEMTVSTASAEAADTVVMQTWLSDGSPETTPEVRLPLRAPVGAFLQKLFVLFGLDSFSNPDRS